MLRPLDKDPARVHDAAGTAYWRCETSDPAFIATLPGGATLARGWYQARADLVQRSGRLAGPRLYIPFPTGGYSEFRSVELMPQGGAYAAEFFVSDPAPEFRFDPSFYPCEFTCDSVRLTPLSGTRRWFKTAGGMAGVVARLDVNQLAVLGGQGKRLLVEEGPRALCDAAVLALTQHARAPDA